MNRVYDTINGGFTIIEHGLIYDRSLVYNNGNISSSNRNDIKNIQVDNGEINFRLIEILPTERNMIDTPFKIGMQLNHIKFDINILH